MKYRLDIEEQNLLFNMNWVRSQPPPPAGESAATSPRKRPSRRTTDGRPREPTAAAHEKQCKVRQFNKG